MSLRVYRVWGLGFGVNMLFEHQALGGLVGIKGII